MITICLTSGESRILYECEGPVPDSGAVNADGKVALITQQTGFVYQKRRDHDDESTVLSIFEQGNLTEQRVLEERGHWMGSVMWHDNVLITRKDEAHEIELYAPHEVGDVPTLQRNHKGFLLALPPGWTIEQEEDGWQVSGG